MPTNKPRVSVVLSDQEYADLKAEAERDDRTQSTVLKLALRRYLAERGRKTKENP